MNGQAAQGLHGLIFFHNCYVPHSQPAICSGGEKDGIAIRIGHHFDQQDAAIVEVEFVKQVQPATLQG